MKKLLIIMSLFVLCNLAKSQQVPDSIIQNDYLQYVKLAEENGFVVQSKDQWFKSVANNYNIQMMFPTAPGNYLVKAKNQILGGLAMQFISSAGIIVNAAVNYDGGSYKTINAAMGGLSVLGLIMQISGVVNIGRAGVSLNENGVGINFKF